MKLSIFCPFGLKTPIHAPKLFFFFGGGVFHVQNEEQYQRNPQKAILVDSVGGGFKYCPLRLTRPVAVNTALALPRSP